jgi:tetratricopeptide (TPR) repeat protein
MYYNNAFGQYDTALECYNRGLALDPRSGICWYGKGTTLRNMKQFTEAETCFENAKKIDPSLV